MAAAVEVQGLTKKFGDFTAVNSIKFSVKKGEIFGFLGPNGAGKTTTIKMLCGLLKPTDGEGKIAEFNIMNQQREIKNIIGYMSQKFSLYEDLTVYENLRFFSGIYGIRRNEFEKKLQNISDLIHLDEIKNYLTSSISLGWKQRLALACAILHEPKIIFLDEPTSGVAPDARRRFWNLITTLADKGVTVFVTTHYMDEAEHCDRLAFINRGEIIAKGNTAEIKGLIKNETLLELKTTDILGALNLMENLTSIVDSAPFGNTIHITTKTQKKTETEIKKILKEHNINLISLKKINPSLEDVFVKLIKAQNA